MKKYLFLFVLFSSFTLAKEFMFPIVYNIEDIRGSLDPVNRLSSYPYISGDSFRSICDFQIDEANRFFDPARVRSGDTIFLHNHTVMLDFFFANVHPHITVPYILVSHNGDKSKFDSYKKYLDDESIVAWFGVNLTLEHKKAIPVPIGLANKYYDYGNAVCLHDGRKKIATIKDIMLYMNFTVRTFYTKRTYIHSLFADKSFCYDSVNNRKEYAEYVTDVTKSMFVVSPEGNGIDCYRTWEAMLLGAIPIVETSKLNKLFDGLAVVIVDDWKKVNKLFLEKKYVQMNGKKYKTEKLFMDYWIKKIQILKDRCKKS